MIYRQYGYGHIGRLERSVVCPGESPISMGATDVAVLDLRDSSPARGQGRSEAEQGPVELS